MDDFGILPVFHGVAVHDGWASYRDYACTHALCNAHHLRELIYLEETTEQTWPRKMIDFLRRAKDQADTAKLAQRPFAKTQLASLRRQYKTILAQGERDNPPRARIQHAQRGRIKQSPAVNLLLRLRQHADDVLRFLTDPRVLFDNNQAERDIRMPKLKQKTSDVSVPSLAPSPSAPYAPTSPRCANRAAMSSMPSPSHFKVTLQILCQPGKLNSYLFVMSRVWETPSFTTWPGPGVPQ